jgi:hypothetical protein
MENRWMYGSVSQLIFNNFNFTWEKLKVALPDIVEQSGYIFMFWKYCDKT